MTERSQPEWSAWATMPSAPTILAHLDDLLTRTEALEARVAELELRAQRSEAAGEQRAQNYEETFASIERSLAILFGDRL